MAGLTGFPSMSLRSVRHHPKDEKDRPAWRKQKQMISGTSGNTSPRSSRSRCAFLKPVALGIGRSTLYVLIGDGEIEIIKLGSSTHVLTESLRSLVERRRISCEQERKTKNAKQDRTLR